MVLEEEEITDEKLLDTIHQLYDNRHSFEEAMSAGKQMDSIHHIVSLIEECVLSKNKQIAGCSSYRCDCLHIFSISSIIQAFDRRFLLFTLFGVIPYSLATSAAESSWNFVLTRIS